MAETTTIDFSKFTFTAEQIRDINELVFDEVLRSPELNALHDMYSGIVYDKEIGFITGGGLVGKAGQGCNPEAQDFVINTRKVVWQPRDWEVIIDECAKDLDKTCAIYCKNLGIRAHDLTDTDYAAIVVRVLSDAIKDMLYRIVWFNDTDATNVSDDDTPGQITDGVDVEYFTIIDGLFKQLLTASTAHPELLVTITANSQATKAAQMSGMTADAAYQLLSDMYYKAPVLMRNSGNMRFLVTQSIADAYQQYLTGKGIESTYRNLVDGVKSLKFLGVDVIPMPVWDVMIQSYFDQGSSKGYYKPHRAVLIEKANTAVGTPSDGVLDTVDAFYDRKSRINRFEAADRIDAKILNDTRFVLGI